MNRQTDTVRIRMYRMGVGDCFLLTFPGTGAAPFRMLIDCGVHQSQSGGAARARTVAADIRNQTGDRIDVVVATHEHWDHISGFAQADTEFGAITAGEVWFAWTEDDGDPLAQQLARKHYGLRAISAIADAEARLRLAGMAEADNPLSGLLGFYGPGAGVRLAEAGKVIKGLVRDLGDIKYRQPGEAPFEIPGADARIFVLGPPRDKEKIEQSDPSSSDSEVYEFSAFRAALDAIQPERAGSPNAPFDGRYAIPLPATDALPFFQKRYWSDRDGMPPRGKREDTTQQWRRIDNDWLDAATTLALKLDRDTNNTSLVLAIELGKPDEDGPVLLFAADAQVGNWLSWQDVSWNYRGRRITGPDLLKRTRVYKTGHHASHNATLRELGLEKMDALELALVPTDAKMAAKVGWGTLPWSPLLDRLGERTKNRVLRTDREHRGAVAGFRVTRNELFYEIAF